MYDEETKSEWSHILGKSMAGIYKGKQLKQIPCVMTDWSSWLEQYPDSTALWLEPTSDAYRRGFYNHRTEKFVLGIANSDVAMAWGFDKLTQNPVQNGHFHHEPVVALFDRTSMTARLYSRMIAGRELHFSRTSHGSISDDETRTVWEPLTGRAISGPLARKSLRALPAIVSYRKTWQAFHPKTRFVDN